MAYKQMWEIEVRHDGLNKYRMIRGSDKYVVQQKAAAQRRAWDEIWQKKQEAEHKQQQREAIVRDKEQKKQIAVERTIEAEAAIAELTGVLARTLQVDDTIDWDSLLDNSEYPEHAPALPVPEVVPHEPLEADEHYIPKLGLFDKIFSGRRLKKLETYHQYFLNDHEAWAENKAETERRNDAEQRKYQDDLQGWKERRSDWVNEQQNKNQTILDKKQAYLLKNTGAVADYCEMVLSNSRYPDYFLQEWDLEYRESGLLVVDYSLPKPGLIPKTKAVKYIASRDEFEEQTLADSFVKQVYDDLLYQIALRTIHELYEADVAGALQSVAFNGWVRDIDPGTGREINACIMSLQAGRDEFLSINLANVDPKACFKQLKGVGSAKLHGLAAVAPIVQISREDTRFVNAREVIEGIDRATNLATMDWQDFEHLIRELFEREFATSGGEVKVTQASRDGGVDAIAFDPDPIRGGKIVIQAKRYTNVVGVGAVRDLYGTTMNEGATKGILVTTSDYGPDAYEFARDKPLTLLSGSNLLHLLEKHGHHVRIDIKEAKQLGMI